MINRGFQRYTWGVLGYNLLVILWGAFVRATGSGAGCGSHWPLCDGEIIPQAPSVAKLIEFSHRATSGVALLLVIGLVIWGLRAYAPGHIVRRGVLLSLFFVIAEALLGAGLVLFGKVASDASLSRAVSISGHLVNTFLLVGALTLTAWWAGGRPALRLRGQGLVGAAMWLGVVAMLALGVSGAVIALGDTLFFAHINAGGSAETAPALAQAIVAIRIYHPVFAVLVGVYTVAVAWWARGLRPTAGLAPAAIALTALFIVQFGVGAANVALRAPVAMQLVHLLLADLVWIAYVMLAATALAASSAPIAAPQPARDEPLPSGGRALR